MSPVRRAFHASPRVSSTSHVTYALQGRVVRATATATRAPPRGTSTGYTRAMPFFYARLSPKRSTFPADMTPDEAAAMKGHGAWLAEQLAAGTLVVAGPVMDPAGVFGVGVFEAASRDEVVALLTRDPATGVGTYEVHSMGPAIARTK
jgi:uncharacterized protein